MSQSKETKPSAVSEEEAQGPPRMRQQLRLRQRDCSNQDQNPQGPNRPGNGNAGATSLQNSPPMYRQQIRTRLNKRNCSNDQCLCGDRCRCPPGRCMCSRERVAQSAM